MTSDLSKGTHLVFPLAQDFNPFDSRVCAFSFYIFPKSFRPLFFTHVGWLPVYQALGLVLGTQEQMQPVRALVTLSLSAEGNKVQILSLTRTM